MSKIVVSSLLACLCGLGTGAHAAGLADVLKGQPSTGSGAGASALSGLLGGGNEMSALSAAGLSSPSTVGNAAGVITYCMKNNYLNADQASQVKDQLLGKMGLGSSQQAEPKDPGYLSGLAGMVTGSGGQSFNLDQVKGSLKEKACDFVLNNAQSLL